MVWSTGPKDDPRAIAHAMTEDYHGRVTRPLCGASSNGLWLRSWTEWSDVPEPRRCADCAGVLLGAPV